MILLHPDEMRLYSDPELTRRAAERYRLITAARNQRRHPGKTPTGGRRRLARLVRRARNSRVRH